MSEWWESAPLAPADDPAFTGYIPGTPKPKEPKAPVFVPKDATQMFDPNTGTYKPVPQPAAEGKDALKSAIEGLSLDELLTSVTRARKNVRSGWATGGWGKLAEMMPGGGTPRDDFLGNLKSIQGGIINEKLQALKDASKTGASGLGALSEKEGERLASSVSALTESMSPEAYEESFKEIARHAYTLQAVRDGKDPRSADTQKAIESQVSAFLADQAASGGGGTPPPAGTGDLTDEQKQAYGAFVASHGGTPSEGDVQTFLEKLLNKKVTNAAAIAAALNEGRGINTSVEDLTYKQKLKTRLDAEKAAGVRQSPAATLANSGALFNTADEWAGIDSVVGNAITAPFTNDTFDPVASYRFGRDLERARIADARQQLGYGGTAIELASAIPSGSVFGASAKAAAAGGALAGWGTGEGLESSTSGAGLGALTAYGLAKAIPAVAGRIIPGVRSSRGMAPEVAQAAKEENVDLIRPMVDKGSLSQFGELESNRFSQPIVREGVENTRGQIADRVEALGGSGRGLETDAAGSLVQKAGQRFIRRTQGVKDTLYKRAETAAGDTRFVPQKAIDQLDADIAQLSGNEGTNASEISYLQTLRKDLASAGGKTVAEVRNIREGLRGEINRRNLTMTGAERRANNALHAAADDIADNVPAAGAAYRRADAYYAARQTHINDIIKRFTGGRAGNEEYVLSGEQAFTKLKSMASPGGDGRRLARMWNELEPSERGDIAATFAQSLGRSAPDQPFSAARFVTMTDRLSPSARRTIFGPEGARSIQNLRTLSRALVDAGQDINRSRSGTLLERTGWRRAAYGFISSLTGLGGMGGAAAAGASGSIAGSLTGAAVAGTTMAASAGVKRLSARAMVNPRVTMWLAEAAKVGSKSQAQQSLRRLGTVISREPALAGELQPIQDFLAKRLELPLAAHPEGEGDGNGE
jgi:hypothetical protein